MTTQTRTNATYSVYHHDAIMFVGQFLRESERDDLVDMAQEDCIVAAARWFLDGHGRWSRAHIRRTVACLHQQIEQLGHCELIPASQSEALLQALKEARPAPRRNEPDVEAPQRKRRPPAKSISVVDLRRLIRFFRDRGDAFSLWIAGLLQIDSRIGWRAGEVVDMWLHGNYLCAFAEKHTNERSLCPACEVDLREYPEHLIKKLEAWISETERLAIEYGGRWLLRDAARGQISDACKNLKIRRICISTLRHYAIACMKKSGYTREEIAVIVNHASTRTATEKYGKGRTGARRAKKRFRIDPWRLSLVRPTARTHGRKKTPTPH